MLYRFKGTVVAERWFPGVEVNGVCGTDDRKLCGCVMAGNPYSRKPHVHPSVLHCKLVEPGDYVIELGGGFFDVMAAAGFVELYEPVPGFRNDCRHSFEPLTEEELADPWMSVGAFCRECGQDFGWRCKESPDGVCHYDVYDGKVVGVNGEEYDPPENKYGGDCIYCGHPDERK